jgi:LPXTG-motif cell wall-anchored protein
MEWGSSGAVFLSDDGEDGIFTFEGLPAGFYKIVETSVPGGYVKLSEDPVFEVRLKADGELEMILLEADGGDAQDNRTDLLRVKDLTIRFGNYPGRPLPHTGGPGTGFFTVFGLALTAAALLLKRASRVLGL